MIKLSAFSIYTILGVVITVMGALALIFALLSGSIHRDLIFANQKIMMQGMTKVSVNESIKDLNQVSQDLGLALQSSKKFNQSLDVNNKKSLITLLDNQFHQYFVTAGIIDLKQIVLFDKSLSFLIESSEGTISFKDKELIACPEIMIKARARTGLQRVKILHDLCLYDRKPINVVVVPVGGLRLKAYMMIITDPIHNLSAIGENLNSPLELSLVSDEVIFKSSKWPVDESKALISNYHLTTSSGSHVMSVLIAQNISELSSSLLQARFEVLLIAGLVIILFIGFSVYVLRRCMLIPLNKLTFKLRHFNVSHSEVPEKIEPEGARELSELCDGFNFMASEQFKAQESDQQKSQFLANMSHEIRTPLSAIIGFSETIYKNENTKEQQDYIERIIRNGKHLHQLIDDILDSSKIEANQLSIENIKVSVCDLIMEIDNLMREKANSKEISFNVDIMFPVPEFITTDPMRLKQILINLCSNAVKFTDKGSVCVTVNYKAESNCMSFLIKDSGIGMTDEQIKSLFKPFEQADSSTTRKYGGTGLGLYISKLLSEKLDGDINVSSMIGVGSLFELSINAGAIGDTWVNSKEDVLLLDERKFIQVPKLSGKILLAEDSEDNQKLISLYVEDAGVEIDVVSNGKLAVEKGIAENFDLILMDMQMPEMGGIEAIEKLREKQCTTPVAVLTANAMKEDKLKSKEAGANCFLTKPINQEEFYSVLQKYLRQSGGISSDFIFNPGKSKKMDSLIELFIIRLSENAETLKSLLETKNWKSLDNEIHKLKGTGSSFGFNDITELCIVIEEKLKNQDFNFAEDLIGKLIILINEKSPNVDA